MNLVVAQSVPPRRSALDAARESWMIVVPGVIVAVLLGAVLPLVPAALVVLGLVGVGFIAAVALRPQIGAYTVIGITPLIVGIDRGSIIPFFRPSEAIALLAGVGLGVGGVIRAHERGSFRLTLRRTDVSILILAVASSIMPLLWMLLRGAQITSDDILYALVIWKFYGIYVLVRASVRTVAQVKVCLYISMLSAVVVAVIAIFQSVHLFGVTNFLLKYYTPFGDTSGVTGNRGGSTLSLPIAVADLCVFNLVIAFGFLVRNPTRRERLFLLAVSMVFILGVLASGELSGVIALVVGAIALAYMTRRGRTIVRAVPLLFAALWLLRPVLEARLSDIDQSSGLPVSWVGRLDNLRTFFWPPLFSGYNFILGIRPSARIATPKFASGWVWIESGYTWLLWGGGIPLFLAFVYFVYVNLFANLRNGRDRNDAVGVAALTVVVSLIVIAVCMLFDPHLTYRGSGDLLFALLALASLRLVGPRAPTVQPAAANGAPT